MEEAIQRRLAAIVSADVVGYSCLMGEDEAATLAALRAHRTKLIDAKINQSLGSSITGVYQWILKRDDAVVRWICISTAGPAKLLWFVDGGCRGAGVGSE
jgi:class 3 adenylate cyclase